MLRIKGERSLLAKGRHLNVGEKCVMCGAIENLSFLSLVSLSATPWPCEKERVTKLTLPQLKNDHDSSMQHAYHNACHFLIAG